VIFVVAIATALLVWHATRASQARAGIQSRRAQIRGLWKDVWTFAFRGIFMLFLFIIVMVVALKHLPARSTNPARSS
jgi:drug/metabolite transporter (DMT)-like permease